MCPHLLLKERAKRVKIVLLREIEKNRLQVCDLDSDKNLESIIAKFCNGSSA